jgi:hypothetical protein
MARRWWSEHHHLVNSPGGSAPVLSPAAAEAAIDVGHVSRRSLVDTREQDVPNAGILWTNLRK